MSKYSHNVVSDEEQNTPWFKIMGWIGGEGKKVLDVGCSSGYFGEKLIASKAARVWGVERDPSDAESARKRGYEAVFEGDLDNFDWSQLGDLKFDSVIFADVLEHVKDPLSSVKAAKTLLEKDGHIYASIPNIAHITVRVELLEGNFDYEETGLLDNTHIRLFTKKTVLQLFEDAGMTIAHFDATINDVPEGQVKAHLKKLGLEPGINFDSVLSSLESRAFQYIVDAAVSPQAKPASLTPRLTAKLHDDWPVIEKKMQDDDKRIRALDAQVNEASSELVSLRTELTATKKRLDMIRKNPLKWLATGSINRLKANGKNLRSHVKH